MPQSTFGFRSLTATSAAAVASLVLGAAATSLAFGLSVSTPSARANALVTDIPASDSTAGAVWLRGTRVPPGDVEIGPLSYHERPARTAYRARARIVALPAACVEGWRGLENGPVGRRVLVTCPAATLGVTPVASDRIGPETKTERLRAPAAAHGRLTQDYTVPAGLPQMPHARPAQNP
jgi:hypothetical protein